jgi:2Fe-2S ferredoxin
LVVKILFIEHDGAQHLVEATVGHSLMAAAVRNSVPGILANCGGSCACATCHVYVDPAWADHAGSASELEQPMLEFAEHVEPTSRLSCQIKVTEKLDGLVVRLPASQV